MTDLDFNDYKPKRSTEELKRQNAIATYLFLHHIPYAVTDAAEAAKRGFRHRTGIKAGWPDITVCLPPNGRFLGIEVKSAKGRQSIKQQECQEEIEKAGGLYVLARSVDDVIAALEKRT